MNIRKARFLDRLAWEIDNDALTLTVMQGGGHIARLSLAAKPDVNPYWIPPWKSMEPWLFRREHAPEYGGSRLLSCICGHNLCLGWFGAPSDAEARCGFDVHGEAPVSRWRLLARRVGRTGATLTCGCEMPSTGMDFRRRISVRRGSNLVHVSEQVRNRWRRDLPFTMCQHVTIGPPFLEKGVTVCDMSATRGHTFPHPFEDRPRLKMDRPFEWPYGPAMKGGKVDLRMIARCHRASADFTTQLMDPGRQDAWFSALNPRLGVLLAYVWRRQDFPWVGNWEENFVRTRKPWAGRTLSRGMEFANTPFPEGLRQAVERGTFHGQPTFRWLPAGGTVRFDYDIVLMGVPGRAVGVADIRRGPSGSHVDLVM